MARGWWRKEIGDLRVLAMDGHSIMRIGLKAVFEREGCEVIGPYATGEEVLSQVEGAKPDLYSWV